MPAKPARRRKADGKERRGRHRAGLRSWPQEHLDLINLVIAAQKGGEPAHDAVAAKLRAQDRLVYREGVPPEWHAADPFVIALKAIGWSLLGSEDGMEVGKALALLEHGQREAWERHGHPSAARAARKPIDALTVNIQASKNLLLEFSKLSDAWKARVRLCEYPHCRTPVFLQRISRPARFCSDSHRAQVHK